MKCRNCDELGHVSRECTKPKDWSRVKCSNCEQMGHGVSTMRHDVFGETVANSYPTTHRPSAAQSRRRRLRRVREVAIGVTMLALGRLLVVGRCDATTIQRRGFYDWLGWSSRMLLL